MSVDIWDYNEVNRVKSLIDEYFYVAIARAVNNKRAGVHVTDLVSECERKRFYFEDRHAHLRYHGPHIHVDRLTSAYNTVNTVP